jgi:hypothetical protein
LKAHQDPSDVSALLVLRIGASLTHARLYEAGEQGEVYQLGQQIYDIDKQSQDAHF